MTHHPDLRPAQFRRYSPAQVRLDNLAATRRLVLDIAGAAATLRPGSVAERPEEAIALVAGSSNAWLTLAPARLERWLRPWIGGETLSRLPLALRDAAHQAALTPLFTALTTTTGMVFTLAEGHPLPPAATNSLDLWLTDDGQPSAVLHLDAAAMVALAVLLERLPMATPNQEPWPTLPVVTTLWIGQTRLTLREFEQIERGDIVLLPPSLSGSTLELVLRHARRSLAVAHLDHHQLLIDRLLPATMSEPAATAHLPLNPDDLEIRIDFDLGQLTLPLRELRAIQPGYSFVLTPPGPQPVRIVAGSQVMGYGELVQIDERLGVRITTWFQPPG